jgi:hypothetical protein
MLGGLPTGTKGQVLWPPGLLDLQLAVEPSKERNLLENV